jgi:hypothetical protein
VLFWVEQLLGVSLTVAILIDVYLTVLYARVGSGLFSYWLARGVWWSFFQFSRLFDQSRRGKVLSFCGPTILVATVLFWSLSLALGAGLLFHPNLGTAIVSSSGDSTPRDLITAIFAGGSSLSIVGGGDFKPVNGFFRVVFLFNSIIGMSVLSLTISYLMQIYSALNRRNAVALLANLMTRNTGDAVELISSVGPKGKFEAGYTNLSELAVRMVETKEGHHFYPVLFYFRFRQSMYAMSQLSLLSLDASALIRTALDPDEYEWLRGSAAVGTLNDGTLALVDSLTQAFLPDRKGEFGVVTNQLREQWRQRYFDAVSSLRRNGISTNPDEEAGAGQYVSIRANWNHFITALAPVMQYELSEIDPATSKSPALKPLST